jgi:hypothetical protein
MFRQNLSEPEIDKQKTNLLTRGATRVHVIQGAIDNEICSDDKDALSSQAASFLGQTEPLNRKG